ncbi:MULTISPECIES: xanthine dehydrogenase family protein molybdopterin-binding subunit [unclassified Rhizobacter]|uniref:xanthine dehydrogenase family protein molybdopterin-binding subunit n=1 Tax=unclassified Rhizobacter TaxID=2640088 RepID=UPI0006FC94EA|nr:MULTISPECIES: xanthine dehydrogenase family protein molybdopterin-binding subunit [unclassified Rhizobacter]KQU75522.1 acylaldehyde oxidase [Rhizobacter sp. Root29]KQW06903.1 acylaldehyde oxidase [Rhizobacter sp. Root1238]KRB18977.1 acylaldehyde oxidase [Rhizobacter sp. Root16D2]
MKRRYFLLAGLGAAGALIYGVTDSPDERLLTAQAMPVSEGQLALNGWVKIGADDWVTVVCSKSEMGQGIYTALAMLVAEELDADWSRVRVEASGVDKIYNNVAAVRDSVPYHPRDRGLLKAMVQTQNAYMARNLMNMMTGGSSSVKDTWQPMRRAGAMARMSLLAAAARYWTVPEAECTVSAGVVAHPSGRSARFGELIAKGVAPITRGQPTLKTRAQFKLIGKPLGRLDSSAKATGTAGFGIDVQQPGQLHAAIAMSPVLGGTVAGVDSAAALAMKGVNRVIVVPPLHGASGGVAVVADNWYRAKLAVEALKPQWVDGAAGAASSAAMLQQMVQAAALFEGSNFGGQGDAGSALATATRKHEAHYTAPWLAHATMEPMNCTVLFKDGKATVWAPTQVPDSVQLAVAKVCGIEPADTTIHVTLLGGGFGRRLEVDFAAQAAFIAKELSGLPVQLLWSREEDTRHDFYRPACAASFRGGLDANGALIALEACSAGQSLFGKYAPRAIQGRVGAFLPIAGQMPPAGPDKTVAEGVFDQPYDIPNLRVMHRFMEFPVPVGFWRSVGHSHQAFFKESFIDEMAHAAATDPLKFRQAMLGSDARAGAVLQLAAEKAGWGSPIAPAADGRKRGRGIALHWCFGTWVAQVVEASVGSDQGIRVERVVCAVDCGLVVNPRIVAQQMESAVVYGLSAALHGDITIEQGRVQQGSFHDYAPLRLSECPVIETHIVASDEDPEGMGEPGLPPVAPALANAIFAATGKRLRNLPLKMI